MSRVLILNSADDVAIALDDIAVGETPEGLAAPARADIATGHKIARHAVEEGGLVRRYGQVIGRAKAAIAVGDHVHVHNPAAKPLALSYEYSTAVPEVDYVPEAQRATFQGFKRALARLAARLRVD